MDKCQSIGKVKMIDDNEDEILKAEYLRFRAYNLPTDLADSKYSYYYMKIKSNGIVPYALYIRDKMVAACYVSHAYDSLFIEQLFVMPELQNSGLKLGRLLLRYVLANKDELSDRFESPITKSSLESLNEKTTAIYTKEGYKRQGFLMVKKLD